MEQKDSKSQIRAQCTATEYLCFQHSMDMASEKGSSSWLVALPIESYGFSLHKGAFRDAISLRYGWQPSLLPTFCVVNWRFPDYMS